jgi:hypothetical protein
MEKKERKGAAGNARKTSQGSRGGNRKVSLILFIFFRLIEKIRS